MRVSASDRATAGKRFFFCTAAQPGRRRKTSRHQSSSGAFRSLIEIKSSEDSATPAGQSGC
jgi:hypothetical protein